MIKREKLIEELTRVLDLEKNLVPLFNKDVSSALTFSGLLEKDSAHVLKTLQEMARIHERHVEALTIMKARIVKDGIDVY